MNPRRFSLGAVGPVLALTILTGCNDHSNSGQGTANTRSPVTAPLDYLAAQGQAKKHSEKVISLVEIQQAIQQFNAMEERLPRDLNELVAQHYLGKMPSPPRGQRFLYDPQTGSIRVGPAAPGP